MKQINKLDGNDFKFNFAIVVDVDGTLDVFLSDKRKSGCCSSDIILENVEVKIADNGSLRLKGNSIDYFYNGSILSSHDPLSYEELKREDKFILKENNTYRRSFMGISYGKVMYRNPWIEYKERKPYEVVTSNYRINNVK